MKLINFHFGYNYFSKKFSNEKCAETKKCDQMNLFESSETPLVGIKCQHNNICGYIYIYIYIYIE